MFGHSLLGRVELDLHGFEVGKDALCQFERFLHVACALLDPRPGLLEAGKILHQGEPGVGRKRFGDGLYHHDLLLRLLGKIRETIERAVGDVVEGGLRGEIVPARLRLDADLEYVLDERTKVLAPLILPRVVEGVYHPRGYAEHGHGNHDLLVPRQLPPRHHAPPFHRPSAVTRPECPRRFR